MASSLEYVQYVAEQISRAGNIAYKRMFGEFGLFCDGKYFGCICDDRFLIKITKAGEALMPDCPKDYPYEGGSLMFFLEELDDREFLEHLVRVTCAELPVPKPRKKKHTDQKPDRGKEPLRDKQP